MGGRLGLEGLWERLMDAFAGGAPNSELTLVVERQGDGWCVLGPAGRWRRFAYRVDAEEAALRRAEQFRGTVARIVVVVRSDSGDLRPIRVS